MIIITGSWVRKVMPIVVGGNVLYMVLKRYACMHTLYLYMYTVLYNSTHCCLCTPMLSSAYTLVQQQTKVPTAHPRAALHCAYIITYTNFVYTLASLNSPRCSHIVPHCATAICN
jgi:hypothetical protein